MMLNLITALLLPVCMVTAHVVDAGNPQATGLAAVSTEPDVIGSSLIEPDSGATRELLGRKKSKKGKNKLKKKKKSKKNKKKSKKKGTPFIWKGKGKGGFKFKRNRPHGVFKRGEIVYDADGIKCRAKKKETDKINFSKNAEVHAAAVAEAFEYVCNPGEDFDVSKLEEIFEEGEAFAFAHAAVKAKLKCKSKGKDTPNTCISYSATATAIAEATATAHADAAAAAIAKCPCLTEASAEAFGSTSLYIELIADASVTAEATVCVEGKSKSKAVAWESCTSVLYAKLFAKAVAQAASFGTCLTPDAAVAIDAFVEAEITQFNTPQCDVEGQVNVIAD